jgi:hypothetical protein
LCHWQFIGRRTGGTLEKQASLRDTINTISIDARWDATCGMIENKRVVALLFIPNRMI